MVFNLVKVVRVEPGAELDGTVYDQWVHVEFNGLNAALFDQMMIAPEHSSGEMHEVKISVMSTGVEHCSPSETGIAGNRFTGKVVAIRELNTYYYDHLLDIQGLRVHLIDDKLYDIGGYLTIKGRLDLYDIQYPSPTAWEPA
jgi:hypothetical protein